MITRKTKIASALVVGLVLVAAVLLFTQDSEIASTETSTTPVVQVTTPAAFSGDATISLIGTVRAFSEAAITTEQSGRVTGVRVGLGDQVVAGQIIATLENASQQAAVLQAEGVYEAALAAAAQNNVGTSEAESQLRSAKNNAVTVIQTAYNSAEGAVFNDIDQFFADPDGFVPGLRIAGQGFAGQLNDTRVAFQELLPQAESRTRSVTVASDLDAELAASAQLLDETIAFLDTFVTVFNQQEGSSRYSDAEIVQFGTSFNATRGSLIQLQAQIDAAVESIDAAEDRLERAQLSASGGNTSAADAQVKQALGGLRAAQANLAKTIIRTPITGTVNNLSVRTGDFVSVQQQIAEVANNNALEIVTAVGENEREMITVGDTVKIEDDLQGSVTEVAPAVDPSTGKIEVRIAAESSALKNGDTVTITKQSEVTEIDTVFVPLSAVKFEQTDGFMFFVENDQLATRPVSLGVIRGGSVEVREGLGVTDQFVVDARGLQPNTSVEIAE